MVDFFRYRLSINSGDFEALTTAVSKCFYGQTFAEASDMCCNDRRSLVSSAAPYDAITTVPLKNFQLCLTRGRVRTAQKKTSETDGEQQTDEVQTVANKRHSFKQDAACNCSNKLKVLGDLFRVLIPTDF